MPGRAERYTFQAADLTVDLSKNLVTEEILGHLLEVAKDVDVPGRYPAMISGEHINVTEDRAVLHTALRRPASGDARARRARSRSTARTSTTTCTRCSRRSRRSRTPCATAPGPA